MNQKSLRKRYDQMSWTRQLGNLASTVARLSSRCTHPDHDALVAHLLREAALMIEWSAPHVAPAMHPDLAAMQREVLAWRHHWPLDSARPLLALRARQMSDALLSMAGLVNSPER